MINSNLIDEYISLLPQEYIANIPQFKKSFQQSYETGLKEIQADILQIAGQIQILDNFMKQQKDTKQIYELKDQYEINKQEDENLKVAIVENQKNIENNKLNFELNAQTLSNKSYEFEQSKARVYQSMNEAQNLKNETSALKNRIDRKLIAETCAMCSPPQLLPELLFMFILIVYNKSEREYPEQKKYLYDIDKFINTWKAYDESTLSDRTYFKVVRMFEFDQQERTRAMSPLIEYLFIFIKNTLELHRMHMEMKPIVVSADHLNREVLKLQDECSKLNEYCEQGSKHLQELLKQQEQTTQYVSSNKSQYFQIKIKCQVYDIISLILNSLHNKKEQLETQNRLLIQQIFIEQIQLLFLYKPISILIQDLPKFLNTNKFNLTEFELLQMRIRKLISLENNIIYIYDPHLVCNYINLTHNISKNAHYHIIKNQIEYKSLYIQQYQLINLDIDINCLIQLYQDYTYLNQYQNQKSKFDQQLNMYLQNIIKYITDENIAVHYQEISKYDLKLINQLTVSYYSQNCPEICASIYFQLVDINQKLHFLQIPDILLKNDTELMSFEWFNVLLNGMLQYTDQKTLLNIVMLNQQKIWENCFKKNQLDLTLEQKELIVQLYLKGIQNLQISKCLISNFILSFSDKIDIFQSKLEHLQSEYKIALECIESLEQLHQRLTKLELFKEKERIVDAELLLNRQQKEKCIDDIKDQKKQLEQTNLLLQVEQATLKQTIKQLKTREVKLSLKDCYEITKQDTPDDLTYELLQNLMLLIKQPSTWMAIKQILSNSHYLNEVTNLDMDSVNQDWIDRYLSFKIQHPFQQFKSNHENIGIQHIYKFLDQIVRLYSLNQDKKLSIKKIDQYEENISELEENIKLNEKNIKELFLIQQNIILEEQNVEALIQKEESIQNYLKKYQLIEVELIRQTQKYDMQQDLLNKFKFEICALQVFQEMIINEPYLITHKQQQKSFLMYQGNFRQDLQYSQNSFQLSLDLYSVSIWEQQTIAPYLNLLIQQRKYLTIFSTFNNNKKEIEPLKKLHQYWHLINSMNINIDIQKVFTDKLFLFAFNSFQLLVTEYSLYEVALPIIGKIIGGFTQDLFEGIVSKSYLFNQLVDETINSINKDLQNLYLLQLTYLILSIYHINQSSNNEMETLLQIKNGGLLQERFKINLKQQTQETMEIFIKDLFKRNNIDQQFKNGNMALSQQK